MKVVMAHPLIALAAAGVGIAIVVVLTLIDRGAERGGTCRAALIPAYVLPHELAALAVSARRPQMVIVNPDSGPGAGEGHAYGKAVRTLQAAGIRVLGYVPTTYGARPLADVLADVRRYLAWYGVDGIFFDEASANAALLPYYRAASRQARGDARRVVVLNPGVPPAAGYFDVADVVVTFEGPYAGYARAMAEMPEWLARMRPGRVAHLIYDATDAEALDAVADAAAGYVYATSGAMPNPWRSLPSYLRDEEEALTAC
jgi:Spherulation-specific family 4